MPTMWSFPLILIGCLLTFPASTSTEPIRLVNGDHSCSGRVEIYYNREWGTVCDDNWDIKDAEVVCRQLGCGKALSAPPEAFFGQGSGTTWLDNVGCSGTESSITQCSKNRFGDEDCKATEDAGVVCVGNIKTPSLVLLTTNTALLPGESVQFRCAITSLRLVTANVRLYRNGIHMQSNTADQNTMTFSLSSQASSGKGSYTCDYYYQGAPNVISSKSNVITITIVSLVRPQISAPTRITWGQALSINCSISTQHTGGSFNLKKGSGSFIERKSTSGNSVTFTVPHADFSDEGSYYCQYQTTVSNREFTSPRSNTISVSVVAFMVPFIAAGVTGGVVLLLMFGLVCIFWARRKQTNTRQTTSKYTVQSKLNTYGNTRLDQNEQGKGEDDDYENVGMEDQDGCEDEDQDDYENVEMEDQDGCEDEDQDDYENVEMKDQDDCEDNDEDVYENVEDYVEELDTGHEAENIYGNC